MSAVGHVDGSSDLDWTLWQVWSQLCIDWSRITSDRQLGSLPHGLASYSQPAQDPAGSGLE